jgi:hypothetical protein
MSGGRVKAVLWAALLGVFCLVLILLAAQLTAGCGGIR